MIPQTFEEWVNCIVNDCKIELTEEFASKRLETYENSTHPETKKFLELYGETHLNNIKKWFKQIKK